MNYKLSVYDKYKDLSIKIFFRKSRVDGDFLIIMNERLEMVYLTSMAKEMMTYISDNNGIKVNTFFENFFNEYEIDEITLKNDIIDFIKDMQRKDMLLLEVS